MFDITTLYLPVNCPKMAKDGGLAGIIKNAAKEDTKRASYVFLMEKYKPRKLNFTHEGDEEKVPVGFSVRFR